MNVSINPDVTSEEVDVLIIDDEPTIRALIRNQLQQNRLFQVYEADDGASGLAVARQVQPAVVICDLKLPDASGFDVIEALLRERPDLPVIVVSGAGQLDDAVRALKLGAIDYFSKPIANLAVLEHAIQQALEHANLRQRNQQYQLQLEQANQRLEANLRQLREDEEAGRRLQFQLLPPETQVFSNVHCSRRLCTSLYLSGDFVDYFRIDDDHVGFYIADVAGHGVSPAFITILLKSYMNRYLELFRQAKNRGVMDPAKIMTRLNHNLLKSGMGKHLTMFYGIIELIQQRLHYCNAGQFPYPILYNGKQACFIESQGKPIGMFEFAEYQSHVLQLPEQFALVLLSDGVLEVLPQAQIGDKLSFLLSLFDNGRITINNLSRKLGVEAEKQTLPDDVTLMLVKRGF